MRILLRCSFFAGFIIWLCGSEPLVFAAEYGSQWKDINPDDILDLRLENRTLAPLEDTTNATSKSRGESQIIRSRRTIIPDSLPYLLNVGGGMIPVNRSAPVAGYAGLMSTANNLGVITNSGIIWKYSGAYLWTIDDFNPDTGGRTEPDLLNRIGISKVNTNGMVAIAIKNKSAFIAHGGYNGSWILNPAVDELLTSPLSPTIDLSELGNSRAGQLDQNKTPDHELNDRLRGGGRSGFPGTKTILLAAFAIAVTAYLLRHLFTKPAR